MKYKKESLTEGEEKLKEQRKEQNATRYLRLWQDITDTVKVMCFGQKASRDEYVKEFYRHTDTSSQEKRHSQYTITEKITFVGIAAIILNILVLIIRYFFGFSKLDITILSNSPLYILPFAILPFILWVIATNENFFAFHQRKRIFFYLASVNAALILLQPVYSVIRNLTVPVILLIPTNPCLTEKMVMLLAYIVVLALFIIATMLIYTQIEPIITSDTTKRQIELFKLQHIKDDRESRQYKYDVTAVKSLETGKPIRIKENDRFTQTCLNGVSGTGKTSSYFGGVILNDLDQKVKNREKRQEEFMQMILDGKATLQGPLSHFKESAVVAIGTTKNELKRNEKALANIRKKYQDMGMTVIAPNPDLMETIIKMCEARDIDIDIVDPVYHYPQYPHVHEIGINPFYVPLDLDENERVIWISKAASVFADVLIATNQMGGQSDVYFTDISLSVSSNVASVVMLAKNIKKEQAYFDDVADCISNFGNLESYVRTIEEYYNIKVVASSTTKQKGNSTEAVYSSDINATSADRRSQESARETAKKNPYYQQILFVKQELLGDGKEAMFSQARGLRNLMTKIVQDPRIKAKLSCRDEERIDFDQSLAHNHITVVSTAIELGQSVSTSFGLFFLLLFCTSALRRPKNTRTPHFLWIDEASGYCHPIYNEIISLMRQYKVAAVLTIQTLTQLEKNAATSFLKNVFLGAGTQIVFGRLGVEEMKIYSEMAGISREPEVQKSSTQNSILAENPTYSESVRTSQKVNNIMEGADLRILDFQELTIFTIDNGRVLPGQFGRLFFIGEDAFDKKQRREFLWEKAVPEAFMDKANVIQRPEVTEEKVPEKVLSEIPPGAQRTLVSLFDETAQPIEGATNKELDQAAGAKREKATQLKEEPESALKQYAKEVMTEQPAQEKQQPEQEADINAFYKKLLNQS